MKNKKEKVLNVKRLLIGVLVGAMLLTMVPFENIGSLVARAEVSVTVPTENVLEVTVGDVASFQTALIEYEADLQTDSPSYSNGVVITLSEDLDFSKNETLVSLPTGDIYIILDGYSLYSCASLQFVTGDTASLEYATNMYISGAGNVQAGSMDITTVTDWEIPAQAQVSITSEADTSLTRFCVCSGAAAFVGEKDLSNVTDSGYSYVFYNSEEGLYKYEYIYNADTDTGAGKLYIEELSASLLTETSFDVQGITTSALATEISSYEYAETAIQAIPTGVTLTYDNGLFVGEYDNPGVSLIVDEDFGLYHVSDDGTSLTIYAIRQSWSQCKFYELDSENAQLQIFRDFCLTTEDGSEVMCKNVTFASGAIPVSYTDSNDTTYNLKEVIIYPYGHAGSENYERNFINFTFDLSNFTAASKSLNVFNRSGSAVTIIGNGTLYVTEPTITWSDNDDNNDYAQSSTLENAFDSVDSYYYVKAGDVLTLTPDDGYTIYDIQLGDWSYDETDSEAPYYSYSKGRRAEIDNIIFHTDGTVDIIIPNFTADVAATVEAMSADTDGSLVAIDKGYSYEDADNGGYWYEEAFTISNSYGWFELYEVTSDGTTGEWSQSITESEEGTHTATYYIIDKTVDQDVNDIDRDGDTTDYVPSGTYGKIMYFDYSFVIDKASPEITTVIVTDKNGDTLTLDGGWASDWDTLVPEIVWTNQAPVTVAVTEVAVGNGTAIEGYSFGNEWQTDSTYTYSDDGIYDIYIEVRDEFDAFTGRTLAGVWISKIGLDTTAPEVFTNEVNGSILQGNAEYEGNLYFTVEDAGIGVDTVVLYENVDGAWVENAEALVATDEGNEYYIAPADVDKTYQIVVTDLLGNQNTYENIVVKGYTQDIAITIENLEGVYGEELTVSISIENTSQYLLVFSNLELRADETDEAFVAEFRELPEIASGSTYELDIKLPSGTDVGTYSAVLDLSYITKGETKESEVAKSYSKAFSATLEKANGTGSLTVEDYYYGETFEYEVESDTNGIENVTLYFKVADDTTAEFTTDIPTETGTYLVKAVFPETSNYLELTVTDTFAIIRMSATTDMYMVSDAKTDNGWYAEDVIITAVGGYKISETEDGTFGDSLTISSTIETYSFYVKTESGAITSEVTLTDIKIDKTAPMVSYTDANTPSSTELQGDSTHEGSLYLTVEDTESGVAAIKLYEKTNDVWAENAEALIATDTGYYIKSVETDKTYRVVVTDYAGNEVAYENVVIKGYTQDIEVSVGETIGLYGKELSITITIKNTSQFQIEVTNFALREDITDTVFDTNIGTLTKLDVGEVFTTTLKIPAGTELGEYIALLDISYAGIETSSVKKVYSHKITATIKKGIGTGVINVKDYYFGENVSITATSDTNGSGNVTLYYRDASSETSEFTTEIPTEIGTYEVKAVFAATDHYEEVVLVEQFKITRMSPAADMYVIGDATGKSNWYVENVIINAAEGYTLCTTEDGNYVQTLTIDSSVDTYTFYIKTQTGAITSGVELSNIKVDKTAPEIASGEGIYAVKTWWQKFLEIITFNLYEAESTQIEIKAHDNESGVAKISYYVSETAMSLDDVVRITNWTEGSQLAIHQDEYEQFVVYAKIENNAGLVTYLSTDGIQLEVTEPEKESTIIQAGTVHLEIGTAYQLGEGTWNVSGDATNYTGGITFYISQDGDYKFTQK